MEDKVKQRLEECGLTESQLTKELDKLKEEIKAEEEGYAVLDGAQQSLIVLSPKKVNGYGKK